MALKAKTETQLALLAAAEKILVEKGVSALSVRRIGQAAQLHPALVSYHFGSLHGLLDELCTLNLDPILRGWRELELQDASFQNLDEILRLWLTPMLQPSFFTPHGRALVVLDEIAAHGDSELQAKLLNEMDRFTRRLCSIIYPLLPDLNPQARAARLRFISAATLGPPPRTKFVSDGSSDAPLDELSHLLAFAKAALTH